MDERPPDRLYPAGWQDSPRYSGAYTFMRCPTTRDLSLADVAIIGVPIDTDVMYRPGARFGPRAIRDASGQLRPHAPDAAPPALAPPRRRPRLRGEARHPVARPLRRPPRLLEGYPRASLSSRHGLPR